MGTNTRIIIGSEVDDTKKISLQANGTVTTLPVSLFDSSGNQAKLPSGLVSEKFDSITITYDSSNNISTVVYKFGSTTVATLTLGYTSGNLTSIIKT